MLYDYFSADSVVVLVDGRGDSLLAEHRLVVGVRHRQIGVRVVGVLVRGGGRVVRGVLARRQHCRRRGRRRRRPGRRHGLPLLALHELPGELGAPPDVVVAPAPLERAVRVFRVRAAAAAGQQAGRAVPRHGVRERGRAERVHERPFPRTCVHAS